jgi:hypothetical protein
MFDEDNYKLNIEKFCEIINVGYPHLYIILVFFVFSIVFLYDIRTYQVAENIWSAQVLEKYLIDALIWMVPFIFADIVALYFISKIRRETIKTLKTLKDYLQNDEDVIEVVNRSFKSKIHYIIIVIVLIIFFIQFYGLRNTSTIDMWVLKYELSKSLADQHAVTVSFWVMMNYFYLFTFFYTCIASSSILNIIGKKLIKSNISMIELIDWHSIGNNTFLIAVSWIFTLSPLFLVFLVAPLAWWSIIQVLLFVVSSLFFFTYPIYSTYTTLSHLKRKASIEVKQKITKLLQELSLNGLSEKEISKKERELTLYQLYEKRIMSISSWPIDLNQIMQFFGAMVGTLIPIILSYFF